MGRLLPAVVVRGHVGCSALLTGLTAGIVAGAVFGTALLPGAGTAFGAAVGAAFGFMAGFANAVALLALTAVTRSLLMAAVVGGGVSSLVGRLLFPTGPSWLALWLFAVLGAVLAPPVVRGSLGPVAASHI